LKYSIDTNHLRQGFKNIIKDKVIKIYQYERYQTYIQKNHKISSSLKYTDKIKQKDSEFEFTSNIVAKP